MFCTKCGKEFKGDERFCTGCGNPRPGAAAPKASAPAPTPAPSPAPVSTPAPAPAQPKKKGAGLTIFLVVVMLMLVAAIAGAALYLLLGQDTGSADSHKDRDSAVSTEAVDSDDEKDNQREDEDAKGSSTPSPSPSAEASASPLVLPPVESFDPNAMGAIPSASDPFDDPDAYILPTDTRYITTDELHGYTADQVAIIRNEIYARYGYSFTKEQYQTYFGGKNWYTANPRVTASTFGTGQMNEFERANIDTIKSYESSMGW